MTNSGEEDVLHKIEEMRKELDSLVRRFAQMEVRIDAQEEQLARVVQQNLPEASSGLSSTGPTSDISLTASKQPHLETADSRPVEPGSGTAAAAAASTPEPTSSGEPLSSYLEGARAETAAAGTEADRTSSESAFSPESDAADSTKTAGEEKTAAGWHETESVPPPGPAAAVDQGLETRIGSLWLNRLGVGALLIGFVSLLLYTFQYWNPAGRVACGAIISLIVIWFSHRRAQAAPEHKIFFEGLNALGWSLAYFVAYGMYFIEPLKINPSLMIELPILLATACGGMADAVAFKSEATAILSSSFAYGALLFCLSPTDPSPFNLAFLVIAAALTFVSIRQKWYAAVFVCCCFFFWSAYFCNFISKETLFYLHSIPSPLAAVLLNVILVAGWLVFNSAIWVLKEIPIERRWAVVGTSLVSAFCFPHLLNQAIEMQPGHPEAATVHAWVYGITGTIYLLTARFFKSRKADELWSLHYLIGLSLVNTSRWLKLSGETALCADLSEIALLTAFGLRLNIPMFRYFAVFWSLIACAYWGSNCALLLCGILAFGLCAHLYARPDFRELQSDFERKVFGPWFYVLANIFCLRMIYSVFAQEWQLPALMVQAAVNVVLSLHMRWKTCTVTASILLYFFGFAALVPLRETTQFVLSALLCFAVYLYCRDLYKKNRDNLEKTWKIVYAIATNVISFWAICALAPANIISAGWGLHGLVLIALGFYLVEKTFRVLALSLFALLTLRLLFFDLATAPAIERIISFIVAGAVFVACSYVYTWFSKNILETAAAESKDASAGAESKPER
jgi:hypothetical protein